MMEQLDDDVMDSLPQEQQDKYIKNKLAPQVEKEIKGIEFDNDDDKIKISKEIVSNKTAKEWGTKRANKLQPYDEARYKDNEYYRDNYIDRLQEIISQDSIKTRKGNKEYTKENKAKARELLKAIGITSGYVAPPPTIAVIPPTKSTPQPKPQNHLQQ